MHISLYLVAILPTIIIAWIIYFHDRYEKEPIGLVLKTFVLGGIIILPTLVIENLFLCMQSFLRIGETFYISFIVSGFTEEFLKRQVVLRVVYKSREFNEKFDGIAYCVYAALGFATIENIMYITNQHALQPLIGIYRGIFSVPAHCLFAITMGYYLSLAKFSKNTFKKNKYLNKSLWVPVIFHGIFNFILLSNIPYLMMLFVPFVIYLWLINIKRLRIYTIDSQRRNKNLRE
ncbi:PrsW family intramembrane metalloprotease [Garciella nitratireducens]|uniref:Protease PrsW n=1 Tax=Garciella nitratireducens DSM 15102 TaxID=1121911 RepID=A0A1T4KJU5_9FIRM|nr:PrsW family glutamic-type intramembrane protease [Garciella nitratireducens]SJZ42689.1 Membrane proteinase PrsW, cleaves anti-sigma factor RsiW, M82 family [Garciella nitratireducens DSM 15102]